jgi:hypothetical protein
VTGLLPVGYTVQHEAWIVPLTGLSSSSTIFPGMWAACSNAGTASSKGRRGWISILKVASGSQTTLAHVSRISSVSEVFAYTLRFFEINRAPRVEGLAGQPLAAVLLRITGRSGCSACRSMSR